MASRTMSIGRALVAGLALATCIALPCAVGAQGLSRTVVAADSLAAGRRARVTLAPRMRFLPAPRREGIVKRVDADSLVLATRRGDTTLARADLHRLELRLRTRSRARNMLLAGSGGAVAGGLIGLGAATIAPECSADEPFMIFCVRDPHDARVRVTAGWAAIGGILGGVGGALISTGRWERVAPAARVGLALAPGRVGLSVPLPR